MSFPAETSEMKVVVVRSGDEWVGYNYKHITPQRSANFYIF